MHKHPTGKNSLTAVRGPAGLTVGGVFSSPDRFRPDVDASPWWCSGRCGLVSFPRSIAREAGAVRIRRLGERFLGGEGFQIATFRRPFCGPFPPGSPLTLAI